MMMIRSTILAAVVLAIAAPAASARTIKLDKDGLTAWVPDQWKVETADAMVLASAPNNGATALFISQPVRDLDLAYKNMPAVVKAMMPSIQFGKAQRVAVANLSAILVSGIADVTNDTGTMKIEANIVVLITPGQRALYLITMVQAENASQFDGAIRKILSSVAQAAGGSAPAQGPAAPAENPCWEMKGQPNGWAKQTWHGVSYLLPRDWSASEGKNPDTDEKYLQIANQDDGSAILVFTYAAPKQDAAWKALSPQFQPYGLGDVAWGAVVGERALCAKGQVSDAVLFHHGQTALVMLSRAGSDPSTTRGILGSMRWK
jgi:hypothetical protein